MTYREEERTYYQISLRTSDTKKKRKCQTNIWKERKANDRQKIELKKDQTINKSNWVY